MQIFEIGSNPGELQEFINVFGCRFPGLIDVANTQYQTYRVPQPVAPYPQDYIIDQQGRVAYWSVEYDPQEILQVIDRLLANPPPPGLNVTMTPLSPPIVIPANGGSFQFNASVQRTQAPQAAFYAWARDRYPDGSYTGNLLGPVQINPPVGVTVTRTRTQVVPGSWPAGVHNYIGYAHTSVSYPATDADSFSWTKSTAGDGGATVWEAVNYGEPFPGEDPTTTSVSGSGTIPTMVITPNPFNPTTVLSFELRVPSLVSLKVYDTGGRLVTTLVDGWREAGLHEVTFDGSNLASGIYLYKLSAGSCTATQKMALIK